MESARRNISEKLDINYKKHFELKNSQLLNFVITIKFLPDK